ncbi:MAG: LysR substrate-binding domain-containing protein [Microthrixaceae bacterium]|nr:LysR substrate-binding domain-containing protein [Microthrixaceae bacterium]
MWWRAWWRDAWTRPCWPCPSARRSCTARSCSRRTSCSLWGRDHPLAGSSSVDPAVLAGTEVLLLTDGHCPTRPGAGGLFDGRGGGAAGVPCHEPGDAPPDGRRRLGVTLLPKMSVSPPVPENPGVCTVPFTAPAPNRRIAMFWRPSSVHAELLTEMCTVFRELPDDLLRS